MKPNRLYALAILLICLLCIGRIAEAQSVTELRQAINNAKDAVDVEKDRHDEATDHLNKQIATFVRLHGHLANIELPSDTPATSPKDLIQALSKIATVLINTNRLTSAMREQLAAIETQRDICDKIWVDDFLLAQSGYEDAVDAYNDVVSPEEQVPTDPMPDPAPVSNLYLCPGPCSTPFTTRGLATTSHQVYCDKEPHKTSGYTYYSCPPDYPKVCPIPNQHKENLNQLACGGPCGKDVPNLLGKPDDSSHQTTCQEKAWRSRRVRIDGQWHIRRYVPEESSDARCPQGLYYHCKIGLPCPNSANHVGSGETVTEKYVDANGNEVPNPTLLPCGHKKGSPGSHKKSYWRACGHTDWHCLGPLRHNYNRCPKQGYRWTDLYGECEVSGVLSAV